MVVPILEPENEPVGTVRSGSSTRCRWEVDGLHMGSVGKLLGEVKKNGDYFPTNGCFLKNWGKKYPRKWMVKKMENQTL